MRILNAKNDVYYVDVYKMNENYDSVECSVVEGDLEEIKEYYLNRYNNLRTPHGIQISIVEMDYDRIVWFKEEGYK